MSLVEMGAITQVPPSQVTPFRPALALCKALDLAEKYAAEKGIDLSGQYVHSVQLQYDQEKRSHCWRIQWMWSRPALGGEFGLKIYMDGTVREDRLGP
jgi:hypothetical protein